MTHDDTRSGTQPRYGNHRFGIAPMMDWTGLSDYARDINLLAASCSIVVEKS
ncbi:hypothetical protein A6302_00487 [Methylobrevis pamukkalensis]|uniref:tRNA-dihydrouridine synthase A n=1 Tax=Methylobrevis pamukkalensis TaxID=1439726 RepID=A0A1E3H777_9HYPH|nr:hypothetical protein A6302_00487 [Methylobrevis pamukkalensis]